MNYNTLFESELRKLIAEEISRISENLCSGVAITDITSYKQEVGRILALRAVYDMCEEVNTIINRR